MRGTSPPSTTASAVVDDPPLSSKSLVFGPHLRSARENAKLSQKDLADKVGISQGYLSHVENGTRLPPSPEVIERIASACGLSVHAKAELQRVAVDAVENERRAVARRLEMIDADSERRAQRTADEVWVVADTPLEITDPGYRAEVVEGLLREKPRKYVYWSPSPNTFDTLRQLICRDLRHRGAAADAFTSNVKFIQTPTPASWFSFVLYDPRDPYSRVRANLAQETGGSPTGHFLPVGETMWITRSLKDLRNAYIHLVELENSEYRDQAGGLWQAYPVRSCDPA